MRCGNYDSNSPLSGSNTSATYKELKDNFQNRIAEVGNIIPPQSLQGYHTAHIKLLERFYEWSANKPDDGIVSGSTLILDAEFLTTATEIGFDFKKEIDALSQGIQNVLLENGCLDEEDIE